MKSVKIISACLALILLAGSLTACSKKPDVVDADATTAAVETLSAETTAENVEQTDAVAAETTEAVEETTEVEDKIPETKEEILALYNDAANNVKPNAKSITQNYALNTQTSDATISNKMLQGIANKLINANMGYDKKKNHAVYTSLADKKAHFPVEGEDWGSKLTVDDIASATCTEKNGIYTVVLTLVPDTVPNAKRGTGHAGKGLSTVTKDSIVEGAGSAGMAVIEESSIKLTYKNCKIKVTIDKETGNILTGNYYQDWTLSLTALGIDVSVSFGIEDDYTVNW